MLKGLKRHFCHFHHFADYVATCRLVTFLLLCDCWKGQFLNSHENGLEWLGVCQSSWNNISAESWMQWTCCDVLSCWARLGQSRRRPEVPSEECNSCFYQAYGDDSFCTERILLRVWFHKYEQIANRGLFKHLTESYTDKILLMFMNCKL